MNCRVCASSDVLEVFAIPPIPLVGEFTKEPNIHPDLFPITVLHCDDCKVLQIKENIDSDRLFHEYSFSSSTVAGLVRHFSDYAEWIWNRYKPAKLLEIGCNDGVLLEPLARFGVDVFGLDISENITELAKSKGLKVQALKFGSKNAEKVLSALNTAKTLPFHRWIFALGIYEVGTSTAKELAKYHSSFAELASSPMLNDIALESELDTKRLEVSTGTKKNKGRSPEEKARLHGNLSKIMKKKKWWVNHKGDTLRSENCPREGWRPGRKFTNSN
jgi:hypothetical protein